MLCCAQRSFRLNPGMNTISFTVTSSLQGMQTVCFVSLTFSLFVFDKPDMFFTLYFSLDWIGQVNAHIFLWRPNAKIVISDIDGTITKCVSSLFSSSIIRDSFDHESS